MHTDNQKSKYISIFSLSSVSMARNFNINSKTIVGPIAAFTMAGILYVYTRSSIHAAKQNAARHRTADGGQISWRNESLRRHGVLKRPGDEISPEGLAEQAASAANNASKSSRAKSEGDEIIRSLKRKPDVN